MIVVFMQRIINNDGKSTLNKRHKSVDGWCRENCFLSLYFRK